MTHYHSGLNKELVLIDRVLHKLVTRREFAGLFPQLVIPDISSIFIVTRVQTAIRDTKGLVKT